MTKPAEKQDCVINLNSRLSSASDRTADFEALLMPLLPRAYQVALRLTGNPVDAEDVVQEAALHAYRGFSGFIPGSNFKAWFLKILTNSFLMRCRRSKKRRGTVPLDETTGGLLGNEVGTSVTDPDPAQTFLSGMDADAVERAIHALPLPYRTVAALYFVDDLSYRDIAEIVRCPLGTVRSRLHRARAMLRESLREIALEVGIIHPRPNHLISGLDRVAQSRA